VPSHPFQSIRDILGINQVKLAKLLGVSEQAVIRAAKGATGRPLQIARAVERKGFYSAELFLSEYATWRDQHTARMANQMKRLAANV
jgi:DNA-binding XRE family transcriptional regulator